MTKQEATSAIKDLENYVMCIDILQVSYRASKGKSYFFVDNDGTVIEAKDGWHRIDNWRWESRNYYQTEAEAEKALQKQQFLNRLRVLKQDLDDFLGRPMLTLREK